MENNYINTNNVEHPIFNEDGSFMFENLKKVFAKEMEYYFLTKIDSMEKGNVNLMERLDFMAVTDMATRTKKCFDDISNNKTPQTEQLRGLMCYLDWSFQKRTDKSITEEGPLFGKIESDMKKLFDKMFTEEFDINEDLTNEFTFYASPKRPC